MAGYILSACDWTAFQKFIDDPTQSQLLRMGAVVSDYLDEYDAQFDDADPVADWPSEPADLAAILRERLALPDWYGEQSDTGKAIWDLTIQNVCRDCIAKDRGREPTCEIYWDVIELAQRRHANSASSVTESVISRFGTTPFRYFSNRSRPPSWKDWAPTHSMHPPHELPTLIAELEAIDGDIEQAESADVERDYDALMSFLRSASQQQRLLVVQVDT
jgi:hypothetical protein